MIIVTLLGLILVIVILCAVLTAILLYYYINPQVCYVCGDQLMANSDQQQLINQFDAKQKAKGLQTRLD